MLLFQTTANRTYTHDAKRKNQPAGWFFMIRNLSLLSSRFSSLVHQLNQCQRCIVAFAEAVFQHTDITAIACRKTRAQFVKQFNHHIAVASAVLTVKAVEASARGTVIVLERASDAATVSVELGAAAAGGVALSVGATVVTTVVASGVVLSAAGEAIAFIPNAIGRALLHNERLG